ncbi:hypothetical protein [Flavobacterium sp.]|uniref:hypothetical protein n=1 Tax=Flavobacterium sp. TaxID=239 RepID=UPI0037528F83
MTQLIFKNDLEQNKIDALLQFLKSWNIEAELKTVSKKRTNKNTSFSLATGIWKDNPLTAEDLRNKSWKK